MLKIIIFLLGISIMAEELKVSGARIPAFDKTGKLESVVNCKSATQENGKVNMYGVELVLYDKSETRIRTSRCQLFQVEKQIKGEQKVFLKNKEMDLSGKGFVYEQKSKVLIIHNDVVIYLNPKKGM